MTKGIGRRIQIGVAKEATRGSAESSATYWIPWAELTPFDEQHELVQDEATVGVIEDTQGAERVRRWAEGEFTAPIGDNHFGTILLAALGSVSTSTDDPEAGANTHTFTVDQSSLHQSYTLFIDDPLAGQDYTHALGVLQSLEIQYEQQQFVRYAVTWMTKKGATATNSPSTTTENRFLPQHLTFSVASNKSGLPGSTINIRSLTLTIEKNVEGDWALGSDEPQDFLNTQFDITGSLTAVWQNESDFKDDFTSFNNKATRIKLENTSATVAGSTNAQLEINLAKVTYQELSRSTALNDVVTQDLEFKAHYDTSNNEMIEAKLINDVSSY